MNKTFGVRSDVLESIESALKREILFIVVTSIMLIVSIVLGSSETIMLKIAADAKTSYDSVKGWITFFTVFSVIFLAASIALLCYYNSKLNQYRSSRVTLTEKGVEGVSFSDENTLHGAPFFVQYQDIVSAEALPGDKINLVIRTNGAVYNCLAVTDPSKAAGMITSNKIGQAEAGQPERSFSSREQPEAPIKAGIIYCSECGAKAPSDSVYCPKCGAEML